MYLILLLLFSFSHQLIADTFSIRHKNFSFKIDIDSDRIHYLAPQTDLSISKKKCNEHLFQLFIERTNNLTKRVSNPKIKADLEVSYKGVQYVLISSDKHYDYFSNFDQNFKTLKIEDQLICQSH
jgi:hypothetical protein